MNEYCRGLVAYVIHHGPRVPVLDKNKPRPMTEDEAAAWLDANTIGWRLGEPPAAGVIEVESDEEDDDD